MKFPNHCCRLALSTACVLLTSVVFAQAASPHAAHAPPAAASSPASARAASPPYRSAFTGYRGWITESPAIDWRDANELTHRIGGWRAYAREAAGDAAAPAHPGHGAPRGAAAR